MAIMAIMVIIAMVLEADFCRVIEGCLEVA